MRRSGNAYPAAQDAGSGREQRAVRHSQLAFLLDDRWGSREAIAAPVRQRARPRDKNLNTVYLVRTTIDGSHLVFF